MSLSGAISRIQVHAKSAGAKSAPDKVTEQAGIFPFAVAYLARFTISVDDATSSRDIYTIFAELHIGRTNLGEAVSRGYTVLEALRPLLQGDPTLNSQVNTIVFPITGSFGRMEWNGVETVGFRLEIPVKVRAAL